MRKHIFSYELFQKHQRQYFNIYREMIENGQIKVKNYLSFLTSFKFSDRDLKRIVKVAESKGLTFPWESYDKDREFIRLSLIREITRSQYGIDEMREVLHRLDKEIQNAINYFNESQELVQNYTFD